MSEQTHWIDLPEDDLKVFIPQINAIETLYSFEEKTSLAQRCSIPFYPDAELIKLSKQSWPTTNDPLWYVRLSNGDIFNLDGSVAIIHQLNKEAPLDLNKNTVANYLKFRMYFVLENNERQLLLNDYEELNLENQSLRNKISPLIKPPIIERLAEKHDFDASGIILFNEQLYQTSFIIDEKGLTTETERMLLASPKINLNKVLPFNF